MSKIVFVKPPLSLKKIYGVLAGGGRVNQETGLAGPLAARVMQER